MRVVVLVCHFVNTYTYSFASLCVGLQLASSVSEGRVPVCLQSHAAGSLSSLSPLLFGTRPPWSCLVSPCTRVITRQRFRDDIAESDNEEVSENYFTSEHICLVNIIQEFREEEYEGESLLTGKVLQRINLEGAEKTGWHTTTGSRHKGTTEIDNI